MKNKIYHVLFLCTGNSARSILAECVLTRLGEGRFKAYSAGSYPKGEVHPLALTLLKQQNYPIDELRSKSWDEFSQTDAAELDFIFTVCDNAANEVCPLWPGQPISAHWGMPDPAANTGSDVEKILAFANTLTILTKRIEIFVNLPVTSLDTLSLKKQLDHIGKA